MVLPSAPFYDLPPHHSHSSPTSPSLPAPSFLVVLPSMTRGFRPNPSSSTSSRSNSLFVSPNRERDLSPSSPSSTISGRNSTSSAAGIGANYSPFGLSSSSSGGWSRKETTAKLLDGKNSLFSAAVAGDAAGDRRRLSISAMPMPLGNNMITSRRSKGEGRLQGGATGPKVGESGGSSAFGAGSGGTGESGVNVVSPTNPSVDLTSDREEDDEDEEPATLLGTAAEKLLSGKAGYDGTHPVTAGGYRFGGGSGALESRSAGVSPRGSIPSEVFPSQVQSPPMDNSSTMPTSTLKPYQYPPREGDANSVNSAGVSPSTTTPSTPTANLTRIMPAMSPPPYQRGGSSSYSPRSSSIALPTLKTNPTPAAVEAELSPAGPGTASTKEMTFPATASKQRLPPPFGGFRRSTSHRGEFPETESTSANKVPSTQPTATNASSLPAPPSPSSASKLRPSPLNPPRARTSRRRPQTSSAALSSFGSSSSPMEGGFGKGLGSSQGGDTDSEAENSSPIALSSPGGSIAGPASVSGSISGSSGLTRLGASVFPKRGERQHSSSSLRKGGSMGSGRPGWEGDELVAVLREDGMQVTTLRTSSQMAQHLRHLTDTQASARRSGPMSSPRSSAGQVPLHVLLVPLSDSPTLPSLSLLLAQGTTPSAVCFQQDLLDRARRTEADWLPSALDMISLAARTSRRASVPDANFDLPRLLVVAYSANPALAPTVVTRCTEAGAIGVLQPPYSEEDTFKKIQRMIALAAETLASTAEDNVKIPEAIPEQAEAMEDDIAELAELVEESELAKTSVIQPSVTQNLYAHWAAYDSASRRRSIDTGGLALALKRATLQQSTTGASRAGSKLAMQQFAQSAIPSPARSPLLAPTLEGPIRTDRSASLYPDSTMHPEIEALRRKAEEIEIEGKETALAELLSEMYRQTKLTIDIHMGDYDALSASLSPEHRSRLIGQMSSWDFRPHRLSEADLFHCSCLIFEAVLRIDGLQQLNVDRDQLQRFLFALRAIYHSPNPYHNYVHAVDVVQSSYTFMVQIGVAPPLSILESEGGAPWQRPDLPDADEITDDHARRYSRSILRPQDVFAVLVAAMGHDVGHPGLSNAFMKNAKTPLSQVYEDKSVLENMHCMLVVQLLRKHGFGFLLSSSSVDHMSPIDFNFSLPATPNTPSTQKPDVQGGAVNDFRGFKKLLVETVLATDMSIHFAWIKSFQDLGKRFRAEDYVAPEDRDPGADEEDRVILCQAIIKCADISNPTRPIDISEHWSTVLLEEWAKQASLEKELELPVSVVASADAALQAKGQIGFIDLFTLPLFEAAAYAMPDFQYFADACSENRATWVGRLEDFQAIEQEAALLAANSDGSVPNSEMGSRPNSPRSSTRTPAEKRHKPVFQVSTEPCLLDERYKSLFPMSLPVSLAKTMSGGYGLDRGGDSSDHVGSQGAVGAGSESPGTPRNRSTTAPGDWSGGDRESRGDDADQSPAKAMREAYRQSVRRQTSRQHLDRKTSGTNVGATWKAFGSGKGVEVL